MNHPGYFALYLIAATCFALAACNVQHDKVNLIPLGLLAAVLVPLLQYANN